MILTPEQRVYAIMGLDVFACNKQGGSWTGPLWPRGVLVYDISPALGGPLFLPFSSGAGKYNNDQPINKWFL